MPNIFFADPLNIFLALPDRFPCLVKDVVRRHTGPSEQERRPRTELQPVPGRFGHQPAGIKTGARGASLEVPHRLAGSPAAWACAARSLARAAPSG